ncbi:MAG: 3-oxoacyl-ACP synthase, partial [Alphaproteobacteria bacterium]|nr:3-oxoacyl-ACP synthase [Alphaproteobacteria bacterium]
MIRSVVLGCGSYLPGQGLSNDALIAKHGLDSNNEWIVQRTGISQRHIAGEGEKTSDLATKAAQEALKDANVPAVEIDAVIVATTTSDDILPAVAARVQANLGMERGFAFDVRAVCSGFVYALTMADNLIRLGQARRALVIGAETLSRIIDFKDRGTCFLFGDGAGAVVLGAEEGQGTNADRGILTTALHCDGRMYD